MTDTLWAPAEHVAWRKVREETVLLDVETSEYFSLNPTASRVWELLTERRPAEEIARALSAEYEVPEPQALKDVQALAGSLRKNGLLKAGKERP
ncbi:MAG: PqqD family protein [Elusimicrobiota bacterium]|jgi:hypothetical protein